MKIRKKDGFKDEKMMILPVESFKNYIDHPLIKGLYPTDMGFFPKAKHHYRERKEGANEAIMIYCMDGSGLVELGDEKIKLERGSVFTIPLGIPHKYSADNDSPWSIFWMHFKGDNLDSFPLQGEHLKCRVMAAPEENTIIQNHFMRLFEIAENGHSLGNMICLSQLLLTILSEIYYFEKESEMSKVDRNLTSAINFMYENLNKDLNLLELSEYMGLSKSYLNLIFKEHTQRAPLEFFTNLKIQQACKYLRLTNMYIYEISKTLGYEDQYYFSRIFKKTIGLSPKEYRSNKNHQTVFQPKSPSLERQ